MLLLPSRSRAHGFNLVEAAIVLGIVGLVIGGIWVAAARVATKSTQREIVQIASLALTAVQNDFKHLPPADSGEVQLHNYLRQKGVLPWPLKMPALSWRGAAAPDGSVFMINYYAPGSTGYPAQDNAFGLIFGSADGQITSDDCYYYLNSFKGYIGVINGHGDYISAEALKAAATPTSTPEFVCIKHLTGALKLIFPR